jgi:flagellar operon protein (TIGR03826 family)
MDIRNCRRCRRIFQYRGSKYCPSCTIELDEIFIKVRDYIYDHPEANILQVSEALGVSEDIILEFLREGRLELTTPSLDFVCERCEKPIVTGKYCSDCINELDREMKKGLGEASQDPRNLGRDSRRMYTADLRKKRKQF